MSATLNISTEIHDESILDFVCKKLGLKMEKGIFKLYRTTEEGIGIKLRGWHYPIIVKSDGTISYDNYSENWGNIKELNELKAHYGLEKAKVEARKKGYSSCENYNQITKELELKIYIE